MLRTYVEGGRLFYDTLFLLRFLPKFQHMQPNQSYLRTYLHDHLAGANFAIQLLEDLSNQNLDPVIAQAAANLLPRVQRDLDLLESLISNCNEDHGSLFKNAAGWMTQKLTRVKLSMEDELGVYEAVEVLSLGVLGKKSLWKALSKLAVTSLPLDELIVEADNQFLLLENERLRFAQAIFR